VDWASMKDPPLNLKQAPFLRRAPGRAHQRQAPPPHRPLKTRTRRGMW